MKEHEEGGRLEMTKTGGHKLFLRAQLVTADDSLN